MGQQSFPKLRKSGCVYVDKTQYIPELLWTSSFIFLSRPRRFGKSLLLSTLETYFRGQKELFEGLYISTVEKDWTSYPVLRFDMTGTLGQSAEQMTDYLLTCMEDYEREFGLEVESHITDVGNRFRRLIKAVSHKTGLDVSKDD